MEEVQEVERAVRAKASGGPLLLVDPVDPVQQPVQQFASEHAFQDEKAVAFQFGVHAASTAVVRFEVPARGLWQTRVMPLIEYEDASPEVRAVYDDIMETRQVDWVNNFWKALAVDPVSLRRTWESVKEVMAPGALDPLTKELLYVAVSVTNGCEYCIASHTASARKKGMTDEQLAELLAVVGMANETNALATGYGVPVDDAFRRE